MTKNRDTTPKKKDTIPNSKSKTTHASRTPVKKSRGYDAMTKQTDSVPPTSRTSRKSTRKAKERSTSPSHGIHRRRINGKVQPTTSRTSRKSTRMTTTRSSSSSHVIHRQFNGKVSNIISRTPRLKTTRSSQRHTDATVNVRQARRRNAKKRSSSHGIHRHQIYGKVLPPTSRTPRIPLDVQSIASLTRQHEKEMEMKDTEILTLKLNYKSLLMEVNSLDKLISEQGDYIREIARDNKFKVIKTELEKLERDTQLKLSNRDDEIQDLTVEMDEYRNQVDDDMAEIEEQYSILQYKNIELAPRVNVLTIQTLKAKDTTFSTICDIDTTECDTFIEDSATESSSLYDTKITRDTNVPPPAATSSHQTTFHLRSSICPVIHYDGGNIHNPNSRHTQSPPPPLVSNNTLKRINWRGPSWKHWDATDDDFTFDIEIPTLILSTTSKRHARDDIHAEIEHSISNCTTPSTSTNREENSGKVIASIASK